MNPPNDPSTLVERRPSVVVWGVQWLVRLTAVSWTLSTKSKLCVWCNVGSVRVTVPLTAAVIVGVEVCVGLLGTAWLLSHVLSVRVGMPVLILRSLVMLRELFKRSLV